MMTIDLALDISSVYVMYFLCDFLEIKKDIVYGWDIAFARIP